MIKRLVVLFAFLGLLLGGLTMGASTAMADSVVNDKGLCLASPEKTTWINHDAEFVKESRWKRDIPAVEEVSHLERQFYKDVPAVDEVNHQEWQFKRVEPAVDEVNHQEWQFKRVEPAVDEVSHLEYRFVRTNPGQEEVSHKEYSFNRENPGQKEKSHQEYRFRARTYIEKFKEVKDVNGYDFVSGGTTTVNGQTVAGHWVKDSGWHTIPDVIINIVWGPSGPPDSVLGTGRVNLNVYGGPNVTVDYKAYKIDYSGWSDWGPWSDWSTTNPGVDTDKRQVESKKVVDQEYIAPFTEWKTTSGVTTDKSKRDYFTQSSFDGWSQYDSKKVVTQEEIKPFLEWKTTSGVTKDKDKADWFKEDSFTGWSIYDSKKVVDSAAVPEKIFFKTTDGESETLADASWFKENAFDGWTQFNNRTVVDSPAIPEKIFFKTVDGESNDVADAAWFKENAFDGWTQFNNRTVADSPAIPGYRLYKTTDGESKNIADAAWFTEESFAGWNQLGDAKKVVTQEFIPGYTEYYVPGGDPTRELGESNWTTDEPEGWTFVDTRDRVTKEAWKEKVVTPAKWEKCTDSLAYTGIGDMTWLYLGIGALLVLGGGGAILLARKNA